ncbi:MAG: NAD(P)-dependent oxidoreductase [Pseudomonadota bacterium]
MNIAFIGLGNMGGPMASNILRSRGNLKVFDTDEKKLQRLASLGAYAAENIYDAVHDADVVFTSLPTPKVIQEVAVEANGIINSMKSGGTLIELSTNNLECERILREAADSNGINFLDAPVTGGIEGAEDGSLIVMVGGKGGVFEAHKPLLDIIGSDVKHVGPSGAGYVAKIAQVMLCYLHSIALSEAIMLGAKGGVNPDSMLDIIQGSTGKSYVADRYGPTILDGTYDPGFTLGLAHKDMALALELASSVGANLPMCQDVEGTYREAVQKFGYEQNHLSVVKLLEEANELQLRSN